MSLWERLLIWVKEELPVILHIWSMRMKLKEERRLSSEDLKRDLESNKKLIEDTNRLKSDSDIVDDAIREGERLKNPGGT